eukprot:scaffold45624_cov190-Skeletonema_marinoi.AAC.1
MKAVTTILVASLTFASTDAFVQQTGHSRAAHTSMAAEPLESGSTVVVCTGPTCSRTGGKKALPIMKELAADIG